jgi:hypothetical protein
MFVLLGISWLSLPPLPLVKSFTLFSFPGYEGLCGGVIDSYFVLDYFQILIVGWTEMSVISGEMMIEALRGAATLRARRMKEARSLAAVTPYERATSCPSISFSGQDTENEESEAEYNCHDVLARGAEFLKRSKNGKPTSKLSAIQETIIFT